MDITPPINLPAIQSQLDALNAQVKAESLAKAVETVLQQYAEHTLPDADTVAWRGLGVVFPEQVLTLWEKIKLLANPVALLGLVIKDWRTTVKGILKAAFIILIAHGVAISDPVQEAIIEVVSTLVATWFAGKGALSTDREADKRHFSFINRTRRISWVKSLTLRS